MKRAHIIIAFLILINCRKSSCQQTVNTCTRHDEMLYYEDGIRYNYKNKVEASRFDSLICNTTFKKFILDGLSLDEKRYLMLNLDKKQFYMFNNIITFGDNHDDPTLYHNCMATAYFSANLRCSIYINGKKTKPNDRGRKLSLINEAEIISIRNSHPLFYFGGWRGKIKIITK